MDTDSMHGLLGWLVSDLVQCGGEVGGQSGMFIWARGAGGKMERLSGESVSDDGALMLAGRMFN